MRNDAISREAAIAAVEKLIRTYEATLDKLTAKDSCHESHVEFIEGASNGALAAKDAIAALPADRRWEELRAASVAALRHVEELRDAWMRGVIREHDGWGGTRSNRNVDVEIALRKALDRLAPPADGAEEKATDAP